jgi:nitrogen fixation protein FixH
MTTAASRAWLWPLGLALALALSAGGNVLFMVLANRDASFAVEPDYYQKALDWDRTMAQEAANRALGWTARVEGATATAGGRRLTLRLLEGDGRGLDGAVVTVEALHGARAAEIVRGRLDGVGEGRYAAELPLARAGLWELRLRAERGDRVFTQRLAAELPPRP